MTRRDTQLPARSRWRSPRHPLASAGVVAAAVSVLLPALLVVTSPAALAVVRDDGDDPGPSMSTLGWIGVFVVIPILLYAIITLLVYAPSLARGGRYRGEPAGLREPLWFDGPTRTSTGDAPRTAGGPTLERVGALPSGSAEADDDAARRSAAAEGVGATAIDALHGDPSGASAGVSDGRSRVSGGGASAHW